MSYMKFALGFFFLIDWSWVDNHLNILLSILVTGVLPIVQVH